MNKKHLLVLSSLTALFVVACADASSSSVAPSSSSSTSTPSSSVSSSTSSSSSIDSDETWGIINGDFEDESDVFTFQSAGWNEFIGGEVDGIVAATTYETEGDNQYGALSIESIADQTQCGMLN